MSNLKGYNASLCRVDEVSDAQWSNPD